MHLFGSSIFPCNCCGTRMHLHCILPGTDMHVCRSSLRKCNYGPHWNYACPSCCWLYHAKHCCVMDFLLCALVVILPDWGKKSVEHCSRAMIGGRCGHPRRLGVLWKVTTISISPPIPLDPCLWGQKRALERAAK
jgi:hypothetical protein